MSLLAIVTFDLHGAPPSEYMRVKKRLAKLGLKKHLPRKGAENQTVLPANTFAGKFTGKSSKHASTVRNDLREKTCAAIARLGLSATVFVAVGGPWAWGTRRVN